MPRFADMVASGLLARGHPVEVWTAEPKALKWAPCAALRKWFGYIDQFILFPRWVKKRTAELPPETLFVFLDHALGPWIPLVTNRPHVIHCHDFLAQRSAQGTFPEHRTKLSGRIYQYMIRKGFQQGRAFISISKATQKDLHQQLESIPSLSEVVYNGYNADFREVLAAEVRSELGSELWEALADGFILHVGGNQWYKNRLGVVRTYERYAATVSNPKPLVLVGPEPSAGLQKEIESQGVNGRMIVLSHISFERLRALYHQASFLFFPSLEEGFGWPIAEAMACGCPVLSTDQAPMTEVGGGAVSLLPRMPSAPTEQEAWFAHAVSEWKKLLGLSPAQRRSLAESGLEQAKRFRPDAVLDRYEAIYQKIEVQR